MPGKVAAVQNRYPTPRARAASAAAAPPGSRGESRRTAGGAPTSARDVVRITPPDRDRYVDALRAGSLLVVVLGHWLMADVTVHGDVGNSLTALPWLQPATWVLQVMPLFFLVGGVAHGYALGSLDRRGRTGPGRYGDFVHRRASRLLRPTTYFLAVWLCVGLAAHQLGWLADGRTTAELLQTALHLVAQPLWFVGIYLGVAALAPAMWTAHRRWGGRVVVVLAAGAAVVDTARFWADLHMLGTLNFAFVWLALHQLGFCWRDGRLGRRVAGWMAIGGLGVLVLSVTVGPYPVSMVGLPGQGISNMAPPTAALLAQGIAMVGAAVLARPAAERTLRRPRLWQSVVVAGGLAMTVFLWHLSSLFLVVLALATTGIDLPDVGTRLWWVTRLPWLGALVVVTAALVALFRRFDAPPGRAAQTVRTTRTAPRCDRRPANRADDVLAAAGAAASVLGVLMVSVAGLDLVAGGPVRFVAFSVAPWVAASVLSGGLALLAAAATPRSVPQSTSTGCPPVIRSSSS